MRNTPRRSLNPTFLVSQSFVELYSSIPRRGGPLAHDIVRERSLSRSFRRVGAFLSVLGPILLQDGTEDGKESCPDSMTVLGPIHSVARPFDASDDEDFYFRSRIGFKEA